MRISQHRWFLIVIPADVFLSIQNLASFFRQNFDFSEKIMCFTLYIYIIYIYFVELYIRVDAFRLSKALLFPLPKNDKKLLCSIWDYHTPSWVPPSIGSPLAWSCELTRFQVPLLLCAAVQAQPLLSVWHSPQVPSLVHCFPCVRWQAFLALPSPKKQCRQRVKSVRTRWRNIYTHTCGYCYVVSDFRGQN